MNRIRPLKITVVGDGMVGKTCILIVYTKKEFPEIHVPTVFDNFSDTIEVDGFPYNVTLWDTAGQEEYKNLRILSYPNTDVFLLCYAVNIRSTFENIITKWIPELKHYCPHTSIVLVGTKVDIRQEGQSNCVSTTEGRELSKKFQLNSFLECSAKTQENVIQVFEEATRVALNKPKSKPPKCSLL
ncbi:ras-like GTP-binding protein RhoL [Daphnia pulex]|uniref:ras-like GTP-binding protein RhoL n=1 Tax=Daphnia pulex TaxID=6669 RepID=UPI001EDD3352|nr:ras-like GTP-binding protein RhoL [Daphnia pulex]